MCQFSSFCQKVYIHRRMRLKIKPYIQYILCLMEIKILYSSIRPLFDSRYYYFAHATYIKNIFFNLRLDSCKVRIIFAMYQRMREE